jgi:hypothetical protein
MKHIFLLFTFLHLFSIALQSQTKDQKARQIFKSVVNVEPAYIVYDEYLKDFIIAVYPDTGWNKGIFRVDKIMNINGSWKKAASLENGNGNWEEELSDTSFIVELDRQQYWCFLTSYRSVATRSYVLSFYLLEVNFENIYSLNVETFETAGSANTVSIEYSDNLKGTSIQKKYLDELVRNSDKVYKPTAEDLNINSVVNFVKKFESLNNHILGYFLYGMNSPKSINFKPVFYDEKLFDHSNCNEKLENVNYIICFEYKLGLILFDKALRKYSLIYLSNYQEYVSLKFKSTHQLVVNSEYVKNLIIDLEKFMYKWQ